MMRRLLTGSFMLVVTLWVLGIPGFFVAGAGSSSPVPTPSSSPVDTPSASAVTTPSPGQDPSQCLVCHGSPRIIASTGRARPELYVQLTTVEHSVHPSFTCITCHSTLTASIHAEPDRARDSCATCHTAEAALLAQGQHGDADAVPKLTCMTCHGNHAILDPSTAAFRTVMNERCRKCHAELSQNFINGNPFGMETHLGRIDVATCWDCHTAHLVLPLTDQRSPVNPANVLTTCRRCHVGAPPNFAEIEIHVASSPVPRDPRLRAVTLYMLLLLIGTFAFFGWHTVLQIQHEARQRRNRHRPGTIGGAQ